MVLNFVELLQRDVAATISERADKLRVIVREDNISDGDILIELLLLRRLALNKSITSALPAVDLGLHGLLNLINHGSLEAQSWGVALLKLAATLLVDPIVPELVCLGRNLKFNRIVTGRHCGQIPLKLRDLAALVEALQHQDEEQADERSSADSHAKEVVLLAHLSIGLLAGVLHEEVVRVVIAKRGGSTGIEVTR